MEKKNLRRYFHTVIPNQQESLFFKKIIILKESAKQTIWICLFSLLEILLKS